MWRAAGDCKPRSRRTGNVRLTGVVAEPGVEGTDVAELAPVDCSAVIGVAGPRMLGPPHLAQFGFSPADVAVSELRLLR